MLQLYVLMCETAVAVIKVKSMLQFQLYQNLERSGHIIDLERKSLQSDGTDVIMTLSVFMTAAAVS